VWYIFPIFHFIMFDPQCFAICVLFSFCLLLSTGGDM
jgi:hypothetical protein